MICDPPPRAGSNRRQGAIRPLFFVTFRRQILTTADVSYHYEYAASISVNISTIDIDSCLASSDIHSQLFAVKRIDDAAFAIALNHSGFITGFILDSSTIYPPSEIILMIAQIATPIPAETPEVHTISSIKSFGLIIHLLQSLMNHFCRRHAGIDPNPDVTLSEIEITISHSTSNQTNYDFFEGHVYIPFY